MSSSSSTPASAVTQSFTSIPDSLIYSILRFAAPRWETSHLLCRRLAFVSKDYLHLQNDGLWSYVLAEYQATSAQYAVAVSPTRVSKRLKLNIEMTVARAHRSLCQRMDYAHLALTEATHQKDKPLTVKRLRFILEQWAPLRVNQRAEVGGTLLIECARARFVHERVILDCVRALVQEWGADPDVATGAGPGPGGSGGLTPLCIAAARGMPQVAAYLLHEAGASQGVAGEGRFKLWGNQHKTVAGSFTPAEWASEMLDAEETAGVGPTDLKSLRACIELFRVNAECL